MAADGFLSGPGLQNAVLNLVQWTETGTLRLLHALGLASDANGQAAWPFASRVATETLVIDASLARQLAWTLVCVVLAVLLAAWGIARRRERPATWIAAAALVLLAPWPARSLILADAQATSFHRSPTGFQASSITKGLALYQSHCASCHGADGNGEGPLAASLSTWPPQLSGELLWHRAEGDLFGTVMAGMRDRHGARTMPGFAGTLSDGDAWALIDGMKALAAGASVHGESAWIAPVRAPDVLVHCDDGAPDRPLHALRGERLRVVAGSANVPAEDPRFVTVVLEAPGSALPVASSDCVVRDTDAWAAYAEVSGASPDRFAGAQLLVDRDGWLRAYGPPGKTAWSQDDFLCRSAKPARRKAVASRDGLDDLIAAIDAEPVRSSALGFAHTP